MSSVEASTILYSCTQWTYVHHIHYVGSLIQREEAASSVKTYTKIFKAAIEQEAEFRLLSAGDLMLFCQRADPLTNPSFYDQREEWLNGRSEGAFWDDLPGGYDFQRQHETVDECAFGLAHWLQRHPEVLALTEINISNRTLTRLPPEIGLFSKLVSLVVEDTPLTVLPPEIGQLTRLEYLKITNTCLGDLCPEIGNLKNLIQLDLAWGECGNIDPVGSLEKLTHLILHGNRIGRLPPVMHWKQLRFLMLGENKITELPESFYEQHKLTYVDLSDNPLSGISDRIYGMPQLKSLFLPQQPQKRTDFLLRAGKLQRVLKRFLNSCEFRL